MGLRAGSGAASAIRRAEVWKLRAAKTRPAVVASSLDEGDMLNSFFWVV